MTKLTRLFILSLLALLPMGVSAQEIDPMWLNQGFRSMNFPFEQWYTGFSMDQLQPGEKLITALQRVEDSARNQLIEQIQVNVQSTTSLKNSAMSVTENGQFSEVIVTNFNEEIRSTTSAEAVGVEVKSHYDSQKQMIYAFACVKRVQLANYYKNQEEAIFTNVERDLILVNDFVNAGQKIEAHKRCVEAKEQLLKALSHRTLLSAIVKSELAYSPQYNTLMERVERLIIDLKQGTRVYVTCIWNDHEHKQYEHVAVSVKEKVKSMLTANNCAIVEQANDADYVVELAASTTMRSDGSGKFGIISYYANIVGKIVNNRTNKHVVNISLLQDPHLYSAGSNAGQAVSKAFGSQALAERLQKLILEGLEN